MKYLIFKRYGFLHSTKQEGLSSSLIEAMSVVLTSFGARTTFIPELINEDCIFEPGEMSQIVSILAFENFEESEKYRLDILQNRKLNFYELFKKKT